MQESHSPGMRKKGRFPKAKRPPSDSFSRGSAESQQQTEQQSGESPPSDVSGLAIRALQGADEIPLCSRVPSSPSRDEITLIRLRAEPRS